MFTLKKDQNGLVSIMVASVLMVLMALITLGFTRVVQNEQRQALDNQLSRQAFYAAESGINIAASFPGFPGERKDSCSVEDYSDGEISATTPEVVFTCILINPTPDDLVFNNDSVTTNKSKVVPLKTSPAAAAVTFQWNDSRYNGVQATCSGLLRLETDPVRWNKVSILKVDLIGIPTGPFGRDELINNQFTAFFYPCNSSTATDVPFSAGASTTNVGSVIPANCQSTGREYQCQATITGLSSTYSEIYARFNAVYSELNVRITANDASNNRLFFSDAQAVVDSTGRANDVFSRLQARVPLYNNFNLPSAALQSVNDICKLYQVQQTEVIDNCSP